MSAHIKDGDMTKLSEIFPGKFVLIYVLDRETNVGDLACTIQKEGDAKIARTLIHRLTLGDNGKRGNN